MSDLAPFVAAAIRDKVVTDLQVEINTLRQQLAIERYKSKTVAITGPNGIPVYATAQFDINGNFDNSPELWKVEFQQQRGQHQSQQQNNNDHHDVNQQDGGGDGNDHAANVDSINNNNDNVMNDTDGSTAVSSTTNAAAGNTGATPTSNTATAPNTPTTPTPTSICTLNNLYDMEVRIGGICKARFATSLSGNGVTVEGFVNDIYNNYNSNNQTGKVSIWFASGIWLTISIGPAIDRDRYASLRDYDLSGPNLLNTLIDICSFNDNNTTTTNNNIGNANNNNNNINIGNNARSNGIDTIVEFVEVSFMICHVNEAMERWNLPTSEAQNDDDDDDNVDDDAAVEVEVDAIVEG